LSVLLYCRADRQKRWFEALKSAIPGNDIRVWPDIGDPRDVEIIVAMSRPPIDLTIFPKLRFIATTGAGVDYLLGPPPTIPDDIPIVRVVDPMLTRSMAEYVLTAVLRYHRRFHYYEAAQRSAQWSPLPRRDPADETVGVLGLGVLGTAAAQMLAQFGFKVCGWSKSPKRINGITCFNGPLGLVEMLPAVNILVCMLPLTSDTLGIINKDLLTRLPRNSTLINVGRGRQVVEADLLAALESGQLDHATLDVFEEEPLSTSHPFWHHPRITVTPHVAGLTVPESAAKGIADALECERAGRPLPNLVDRNRGY